MRNPRLRGHALEHEGKPYERGEEHPWVRVYGSPAGVGLCSCGTASPVLGSDAARKRWHGTHKDEIRRGPRIFMLGNPGREETLEQYECRTDQAFDPALETKALEIAPGTRVLLLSTQVSPFGARIAVWHDEEDGCE